jgi:hypothetical protein
VPREIRPVVLLERWDGDRPRAALRELAPLPRPAPSAPAVTDAGSTGGAPPVPLVMHPTVIAATTAGMPASLNPAARLSAPAVREPGGCLASRPASAASLAQHEPAAAAAQETRAPSRLDYGIDLGGASTIDALRALWAATRTEQTPLLDRLEPAVVLRPTGKGGAPQLRLMAGPFADAAAAAALCKNFAAGRSICRPFAFDGNKLPLH